MFDDIIRDYLGYDEDSAHQWNEIIDHKLIEWAINPPQPEEGCEIASRKVINNACKMALSFRDHQSAAPDLVVQNGDCGINFIKDICDGITIIIEIYDDNVGFLCYVDNELDEDINFKIKDMIII